MTLDQDAIEITVHGFIEQHTGRGIGQVELGVEECGLGRGLFVNRGKGEEAVRQRLQRLLMKSLRLARMSTTASRISCNAAKLIRRPKTPRLRFQPRVDVIELRRGNAFTNRFEAQPLLQLRLEVLQGLRVAGGIEEFRGRLCQAGAGGTRRRRRRH